MLLRLYINPSVERTGTKEPALADLQGRHFAQASETHQSFRMHPAQECCSFVRTEKRFEILVGHNIGPVFPPATVLHDFG
jgi:hypothetical protein